ncbi:uncharacterized protein LOC128892566 [Hylaeus anthracinus]|uniref:uncharacterized protein LOC128881445 n=1 Tax=Hylaeus volcanicus TaxID=313075 RepID=UPI0023B87900|nr:uncharacterized protein LOC128881445 [Hylaeus volcanicus]XP_054009079.1 uncharacterized protein LOC128892566 [Hylaeus anthracinus]
MHFWINKPAGRYYGFTGRRYPATPLPKTRFNRCRYNADLRQMVTPLHRFQNLNATGNMAGPSNLNNCRMIQTSITANNNETQNRFPVGSSQRIQLNNISNNVTTAGNTQLILSNTTPNGTNRSLLDFSEFNDAELTCYRFRCCVWISFVLTTVFGGAAKFYFADQGQGIEILAIWGLATLLVFVCLYSILCRRRQRNNHQEHRIQEEHIASVTTTNTIPNETIRPISVVRQNPPPPYHIAILIPPNSSDEAPPPSYDKVMR